MGMTMPPGGFETVLHHLTEQIVAGQVQPGERLPNERDLAEQLGTSRGAVREAIKVLQAQGVVTTQIGPHGGTRITTGQGEALGRMLRLHVALRAISFREVTQTRVVLEREAAAAAAGSLTDSDLADLENLLERMRAETRTREYNDLDTQFHVRISAAADNRLIQDITIAIRVAVARPILGAEETLADWPALRGRLNDEHAEILSALRTRDARQAADLIEGHIRRAHATLLKQEVAGAVGP